MQIKDHRNHKSLIKKSIEGFYQAFYTGDRLLQYSYLSTGFQKEVPLNCFLLHSDYDADFGQLIEINNISIPGEKMFAQAEVTTLINRKKKVLVLELSMDLGHWKIGGDSLYKVNLL